MGINTGESCYFETFVTPVKYGNTIKWDGWGAMEQSNTTVVHAFPRDSPRQIQTKATNKGLSRLLIKKW